MLVRVAADGEQAAHFVYDNDVAILIENRQAFGFVFLRRLLERFLCLGHGDDSG